MVNDILYDLTPWEDAPSTLTPINAENLNARDRLLKKVVDKTNELSGQIEELEVGVDKETITEAVNNYLDENPVQSGATQEQARQIEENKTNIASLTEQVNDLKDNGTGGGVVTGEVRKMLTTHVIGEVLKKTESYNSWVFENVKYDAELDRIIVVWNASNSHVDTYKVCYLGVFNQYTFEFEEIKVINDSRVSNDLYCIYGFVILEDGSYLYAPCYDTGVGATASSSIRLMKSTDKGDSWTEVNPTFNNLPSSTEYFPFSITLLSNGRLLMTDGKSYVFMYSDDNGRNWECTKVSVRLFEPHFVDCGNGKIVCLCRKTSFGTTNGQYNGTEMQIEPAVVFTSEDNGQTWTHKGDSTSITEMTASNCCSVVKDGYIDLFVCSRYPHADKYGVMYHYYATIEDAFNDKWGTPKVVFYPDCVTKSDFSYPGCCTDKNGNTHLFYYDGDSTNEGSTTIKYLLASNNAVSIPLNTDDIHVPRLPYSAKMIDSLFAAVNRKINNIILQGGGSVENDGTLDGSLYVTDGLYEMFDFTMEASYDPETYTYTGLLAKEEMQKSTAEWGVQAPTDTSFNTNGLTSCGIMKNDITENVPVSSYTLELAVNQNRDMNSNAGRFIRVSGGAYGYPQINCMYNLMTTYTNTSGSSGTIDAKCGSAKVNAGFYLHTLVSDGNSLKYYKNGKLMKEIIYAEIEDFASIPTGHIMKPTIGGQNDETDPGFYNKGLRIYNRPLTAEEVMNNYKYESASYQ